MYAALILIILSSFYTNFFFFPCYISLMENSTTLSFVLILIISVIGTTCCVRDDGNIEMLCREGERQALLKFKEDLKDPVNLLSNWVANNADCCSWTGVTCDNSTGHVHSLHVSSLNSTSDYEEDDLLRYGVGGKINPSILELKHLKHLDLSCNNFQGTRIPNFIGSLQSLVSLNLSDSRFEGTIPHQLGNLSSLRSLIIGSPFYYTELKVENLRWISGLSSLQYLDLSGLDLSEAYDWLQVINMLPSLQHLYLSACELDSFSPRFALNSTSLVTLDLSWNYLGPLIPMWLFRLTKLESLNLAHDNDFQGPMPSGLTNLTRLKILDMSGGISFNSSFPPWMCSFKHLESLDLSDTGLKGNIPSAIANLSSISSLRLRSNRLEGNLPNSLGNLCKLRQLDLAYNNFQGTVSEIITRLSRCTIDSLEELDLGRNQLSDQLSGQLLESLTKLPSLRHFDISYNQFNGSFPEKFGQFVELELLDISYNLLEGVVSEVHFINLTRLKQFYGGGNSFSMKTSPHWLPPFQLDGLNLDGWHLGQQLPHWIRWQRTLLELQISNTGISGTIPSWFCTLSLQLRQLNLSHNNFYGEFPCTNLSLYAIDLSFNHFNGSLPPISSRIQTLDFSHNTFSGSVFHFFCGKKNFLDSGIVNLGNNRLYGKIPDCWMKWESLNVLNLENNNLSGVIPSSMGYLTSLYTMQLRNNNLEGKFPLSLQKCTSLRALDLSGNKFIGKIPKLIWISLPNLVVLNLRSNEFQGQVPSKLCTLSNLQILDLSSNNISGTIPRCFYNLSALTTSQNLDDPSLVLLIVDGNPILAEASVVTKGREVEYSSVLNLVKSMDLSSNNLHGEIPEELTSLHLQTLNLSNNHFVGNIPSKIGHMRWLESLDLSKNKLSGSIPPSISNLTFLSHLNLSYNDLSGRIPSSTQLQSFNEYSFIENQLCGPPLQQNCSVSSDPEIPHGDNEQGHEDGFLYLSLGLGFAFGFWVVLGSLLFNVPWKAAFCGFLDRIALKLYGALF